MDMILIISAISISIIIILCMIRVIIGPTPVDKLMAINVIGTKAIIIISIISFLLKETYFLDVVLVYSLISFLTSIAISNYLKRDGE